LGSHDLEAQIMWAHQIGNTLDDVVEDHAVDHEGNIIATGFFHQTVTIGSVQLTSQDESDIFLYKTAPNGTVLWVKVLAGPSYGGDVGVEVDAAGNIYVAGGFIQQLFIDGVSRLTSPSTYWNSFLAKFDKQGNLLWIKGLLSTSPYSENRVFGQISVNQNGIAVAGNFSTHLTIDGHTISNPLGFNGSNLFIARFDLDGNFQWLKNPESETNVSSENIYLHTTGDLYVTGFFTNKVYFDSYTLTAGNDSHSDIFLIKLNAAGDIQWAKAGIKTVDKPDNNWGESITVDAAGNVYLIGILKGEVVFDHITLQGNTHPDYSVTDSFLAKYNSQGNLMYAGLFGTSYNARVVKVLSAQNEIYVAGQSQGRMFYTIVDQATLAHEPTYIDAYGWPRHISIESDRSIYISGDMYLITVNQTQLITKGALDGFLLKINPPCATPLPPQAGTIEGDQELCINGSIQYSIDPIEHAVQYVWRIPSHFSPSGEINSSSNQIQLTVVAAGIGEIEVWGVNECGQAGAAASLATTSFARLQKPVIERGVCDYRISTADQAGKIQWYFNDNLLTDESNAILELDRAGSYQVRISNFCGSVQSDIASLQPFSVDQTFVPNIITPNEDGKNDQFVLDNILIGSHLEIFNRWGRKVFYDEHYNNTWKATSVASGTYYYAIHNPCMQQPLKGWLQVLK
jgi:gliding motility-associated-like protein